MAKKIYNEQKNENLKKYFGGDIQKFSSKLPGTASFGQNIKEKNISLHIKMPSLSWAKKYSS